MLGSTRPPDSFKNQQLSADIQVTQGDVRIRQGRDICGMTLGGWWCCGMQRLFLGSPVC